MVIIAYSLVSVEKAAIANFLSLIPLAMTSSHSTTEASTVNHSLLLLLMHYDLNVSNFHACSIARVSLAVLTAVVLLTAARLIF